MRLILISLAALLLASTAPAQVRVGGSAEAQFAECVIIPDYQGATTATLFITYGPIIETHPLSRPNGWGNLPMETVSIAYGVSRNGVAGDENPPQAYFRSTYTDNLGIKQEIYTPVEGGQHDKAWKEHVAKLKKSVVDFPPAAKPGS